MAADLHNYVENSKSNNNLQKSCQSDQVTDLPKKLFLHKLMHMAYGREFQATTQRCRSVYASGWRCRSRSCNWTFILCVTTTSFQEIVRIYFSCFCSCQLKFREISYRLHSQGFGLKVQYQYMDSFRGNSSNSWFIEDVRFKASVKKVLHTCKNFAEFFFCRKFFPGLNRTFNMSVKLFSSSLTLSYPFCKIPMLPNIVLS